ncbi:hypothetical protein CLV79_11816 [Limimaricola soesokkakensis]|uniref:Regulatory protein SoxS n=1 Tax=Limimaricola soesokkakensis TaxID=1343159 RepID=A0A1X7A3F8_9RHOB|nr:SoxS [Limimaricola soesokkakensis]PSK80985.1 hypothetical protein CLV79_11816 [Limimaricola soesokkakensis]SLN69091.1 hypothetical protein LOS8367_03474 [Limimaricola soesokkakensis]
MSRVAALCLGLFMAFPPGLAAAALELVMVEQAGCPWCARWNGEIGPIYPKTEEGEAAPLRRIDIGELPDGMELAGKVVFTPTFLLVEDGRELGRIEGYPGEDFFWGLLSRLLGETPGATLVPQDPPG